MKNIAIIKNMKNEVIETKSFRSYPEVERYVANKYDNKIFDWNYVKEVVENNKPDEIDLELGLANGVEFANVHTIVIRKEEE